MRKTASILLILIVFIFIFITGCSRNSEAKLSKNQSEEVDKIVTTLIANGFDTEFNSENNTLILSMVSDVATLDGLQLIGNEIFVDWIKNEMSIIVTDLISKDLHGHIAVNITLLNFENNIICAYTYIPNEGYELNDPF